MSQEIELKTCPFCGGEASIITRRKGAPNDDTEEGDPRKMYYRVYRVECDRCGAKTKWYKCRKLENENKFPTDPTVWDDGGCRKAVKVWNRRC